MTPKIVRNLPVILISGAGPHSLGAALVNALRSKYPETPIVVVDKQKCPILDGVENARSINLDLNPLTYPNSYEMLEGELANALRRVQSELEFPGVGTAILAAGSYDCGALVDTSIEARKRLVGVNVCGKIELIHAVLTTNQALGFKNSDDLTLVDVGSLHGLYAADNRSIYGATKAMGLELCASMHLGKEVRRAIHIAPGAIDTHMLHRNHWCSKEGGPVEFIEDLIARGGTAYEDVFVACDDAIFGSLLASQTTDHRRMNDLFERYKKRRNEQFRHESGVLDAKKAAHTVVQILDDATSDGVYVLTAPMGKPQTKNLKFSEVGRAQFPLCSLE